MSKLAHSCRETMIAIELEHLERGQFVRDEPPPLLVRIAELRTSTIQNFYAAERRAGVSPDVAHQRAEAFADRFNWLTEEAAKLEDDRND